MEFEFDNFEFSEEQLLMFDCLIDMANAQVFAEMPEEPFPAVSVPVLETEAAEKEIPAPTEQMATEVSVPTVSLSTLDKETTDTETSAPLNVLSQLENIPEFVQNPINLVPTPTAPYPVPSTSGATGFHWEVDIADDIMPSTSEFFPQ